MARSIKRYKIFQFVIMVYLIAAFSWWAILLFKKTTNIYELRTSLAKYETNVSADQLLADYEKQKKMIFGEGLFFGISILISLVLIYRAFWSEIQINKKLNNFLLSVTHELKTPIASLNLINRTIANKDIEPDKQKALLDLSYEESLRLESLVDNILTAAQMDSSYAFNFENHDLKTLVEKRLFRFQKLNPDRPFRAFTDSVGKIKVDREAFTKLIDNVIDNALKYSPKESEIVISLKKETGNKIVLSVQDEGVGIPDSEKKKVLQRFYRTGSEETRETRGTGLGLFIVKEIAEAHKAQLAIEDNKPKGSIIKIILPA